MIRTDAHHLGVDGFELRKALLEAADLGRSDRREGLNDRVDHHGALAEQVGQPDLLIARSYQCEVRRLLPYLEGVGGTEQKQAGDCAQK
jgi:hypothetical protein